MDQDFVKVASTAEIALGKMKKVVLDKEEVLLANVDGRFYAIGNLCTHEGGPLDEGELEDTTVTCPWHMGQFDVRTGEVLASPPSSPAPVYEVKLEGTNILIRKK